MQPSNLRIFLAILLSLIVFFGASYLIKNPQVLQPNNIIASASQAVNGITTSLSTIKLPNLTKMFTLKLPSKNNQSSQSGGSFFSSFSFDAFLAPSPTPIPIINDTDNNQLMNNEPIDDVVDDNEQPQYIEPTKVKPTKYVKPTKPPPTPTPKPITSDVRPGTSLMGIFEEVGKLTCFPPALLMAFQQKETGVFFNKDNPSSVIKTYNTYGWWTTGTGDPCFGLGYHTQTGIVPQDSVKAGTRCRNAVGDPNDIGIMGVLQISDEEQKLTRKYTLPILPKNIDRRVIFDNALIFAIATKNRVGTVPRSCNDWPEETISIAAEKHHGVCRYDYGGGNTGNYCSDIIKLYRQYK